jgi:hypothetical protein
MITHAELTELFEFNANKGVLVWRKPRPKIRVGQEAGCLHHRGYINLEIDGKHYAAHRVIWFYVTGKWPKTQIDHINGNKSDNRFENLREATNGQNRANTKNNNKHGLKGIKHLHWMKPGTRCWQAQITHNKKVIYLGCFYTKEEAHSAYCDAAKGLHGEFFHSG